MPYVGLEEKVDHSMPDRSELDRVSVNWRARRRVALVLRLEQ
jgi:hypothetical protein